MLMRPARRRPARLGGRLPLERDSPRRYGALVRFAAKSFLSVSVRAIPAGERSAIQAAASASDRKPMTVSEGSSGHEILRPIQALLR